MKIHSEDSIFNTSNTEQFLHQKFMKDKPLEVGKSFSCLNPVGAIKNDPDGCLNMLQKVTQFTLSDEQIAIAKLSICEMSGDQETTLLDLYERWISTPALSDFARAIKHNLIP